MNIYLPQLSPSGDCCNCPERNSPCDNCGNANNGACCNLTNFSCYITTLSGCEADNGAYLGNGSNCTGVDCTCCPLFGFYTEVHFSAEVTGCTTSPISLPEKIWTKVPGPGGCGPLTEFTFAVDSNCLCEFNARNCFPFTEVDYVAVDEIGDCADPDSYNGCLYAAHIDCNAQTIWFEGSTTAPQCCNVSALLNPTTHYDFRSGSIDITLPHDTDPSISVRLIVSLS